MDTNSYIGRKAIAEIPITPTSTGRIKLIDSNIEEFPARSNYVIHKNEEVTINRIDGAIAYVIPRHADSSEFDICKNCNSTIEKGSKVCEFCGEKL